MDAIALLIFLLSYQWLLCRTHKGRLAIWCTTGTTVVPNQGINRSAVNAGITGLITWLTYSIIAELIYRIVTTVNTSHITVNTTHIYGLTFGLAFGLSFGVLHGGGMACIQHVVLRFILYCNHFIPWNYAKFLDYATELLFLRKVGGGYIFIHRLLLEYFAYMEFDKQESATSMRSDRTINICSRDYSDIVKTSLPVQNSIKCTNCSHNNPINYKFCTKCGTRIID